MEKPVSRVELLETALEHLQSAIELLDRAKASGEIAAHADLAASQLSDELTWVRSRSNPD